MRKPSVLITGAGGEIGHGLVVRLADAGSSIITLDVNPLDHSVSPRGFRVLSHIPRLPQPIVRQVVSDMDGLESIVRASQRDLESIAGVGTVRAREIREGLRRLQEHNLVDRYLQL